MKLDIRVALLTACGTAAVSSNALGQIASEAEVVAVDERDTGIREDPNLDHAWLMPTAITQPRDAWKVSDTEVVFLGLSYGVTDDFTVTVGGMPPLWGDYTAWLTGKYRFLRSGRFSLAGHASTMLHHEPAHIDDFDDEVAADSEVWQTLGLAGSFCIDAACRSVLSAYGGGMFGVADTDSRFGLLGGSAIVHVGGPAKLVFEADVGNQIGWAGDSDGALLWFGGVRVAGPKIAVDFGGAGGVVQAAGFADGGVGAPLLPWFKIAFRSL